MDNKDADVVESYNKAKKFITHCVKDMDVISSTVVTSVYVANNPSVLDEKTVLVSSEEFKKFIYGIIEKSEKIYDNIVKNGESTDPDSMITTVLACMKFLHDAFDGELGKGFVGIAEILEQKHTVQYHR